VQPLDPALRVRLHQTDDREDGSAKHNARDSPSLTKA
jgi:hypothetical protein